MISLKDISKSYGDLKVLNSIDLDINRGEVLSIVGPSGAGKTTLLQIIGTLDRPDSGTVTYEGENPLLLKDASLAKFRNKSIGFVFQFHHLLPEFSVVENVAMPALISGMNRRQALEKARKLIEYLHLEARADHRPSELSGGERQRTAVARALINNPKVVLADEPSGSLDSHNRQELHQLFFRLRDELGHTFVIVTHDEQLAADCDRVVHMRDGNIVNVEVNRL
jgi:lipoprotein-releasing system ATP-binding protein